MTILHPRSAIYVINRSTVVQSADVKRWCAAVETQIRRDAAPAWGLTPRRVIFKTSTVLVPAGAWIIAVLDDADQAGALGYHSVDRRGRVYGRVFARTAQQYGEQPSVTFSHEVLETFGDPAVDQWAHDPAGFDVPVELCDAVQGDTYQIGDTTVSNFVYPAWFGYPNRIADCHCQDHGQTTRAPFQLAPGGYTIRRHPDGTTDQAFGENANREYANAKTHDLARTRRRS